MRNKVEITTALIKQYTVDNKPGLNWALTNWWQNTRANGGMRLSQTGHLAFQKLQIKYYQFEIPKAQLRPKLLLLLDQRLQNPYYILSSRQKPVIYFYGSKEALMVNLYGDLERFLENYTTS